MFSFVYFKTNQHKSSMVSILLLRATAILLEAWHDRIDLIGCCIVCL